MSWMTAVAVFLVPLPVVVWSVGNTVAAELPSSLASARSVVVWAIRYVAFLAQVLLLTVAQNMAKIGGATTALQQTLDSLVVLGTIGFWAGAVALLLFIGYSFLKWIKSRLEEAGHVLKVG